jgi:dimethylargininase
MSPARAAQPPVAVTLGASKPRNAPSMLQHAIVRPPSPNLAEGLSSVDLGIPDVDLARAQHARYCAALEQCGLEVIRLEEDADFPDSTFVEDAAVVVGDGVVLTRPGAPSRTGEVARIEPVLRERFARIDAIVAPGTLDGGDVCQADERFFIGVSERTNEHGARQLAALVARHGFSATLVDIRRVPGILHLKSGMSWLGDGRMALIDTLIDRDEFRGCTLVRVPARERYAANCLRVNGHVLVAAAHPRFESAVRAFGYPVIALDMSEFRKMDGALSCLSLRY